MGARERLARLRPRRERPDRTQAFLAELEREGPRLPAAVHDFYLRATGVAVERGHAWALEAATRPPDLAVLMGLVRDRTRVVELGTGPAWTTIAFALAAPRARVTSYDPVVHEHRSAYLALAPEAVRDRIEFVRAPGEEGASGARGVDLLFIDSVHEREPTLAEFGAWRPALAAGAIVVFHDYGHPLFPGVEGAVAELGLEGEVRGGMFLWRAPA